MARKAPQVQRARHTPAAGAFPAFCRALGLPEPVPEYRFHASRKWRIDWAWPEQRVGLEIDGAVWINGRHTRGAGWTKDTEKLNAAAALGYRMFRTTPGHLADVLPLLATVLKIEVTR